MKRIDSTVSPGCIYRLTSGLLIPLWILHAIRHGRKHRLSNYLSMRLTPSRSNPDKPARHIWIHASSVGEVRAVTPLVEALLDRHERILFTSFTATGHQTIQRNFCGRVVVRVIPIDFFWFCHRFFASWNLKLGIVMETELWPELLHQARRHGIALIQINARLSSKSMPGNRYIRQLLSKTIGCFDRIMTRSTADRDALLELGADPERLHVVGNLKTTGVDCGYHERLIKQDYILLASSHAGEEHDLVAAWPDMLQDRLLVIAPRHPARSQSLQAEFSALGIRFAVRSRDEPITASTQIYLADTLGEMKPLMAHASIVVMGGSFDKTGGHNLLEPASLGCTIITGPSDHGIQSDIGILGDALTRAADMAQCWERIETLLMSPESLRALGELARSRLAAQPDMIKNYLKKLEPWLADSKSGNS